MLLLLCVTNFFLWDFSLIHVPHLNDLCDLHMKKVKLECNKGVLTWENAGFISESSIWLHKYTACLNYKNLCSPLKNICPLKNSVDLDQLASDEASINNHMHGSKKFCQRGGPFLTFFLFLVDERKEDPNTTMSGPSPPGKPLKWRFAGVLMMAQHWMLVWTPVTPSGSVHESNFTTGYSVNSISHTHWALIRLNNVN